MPPQSGGITAAAPSTNISIKPFASVPFQTLAAGGWSRSQWPGHRHLERKEIQRKTFRADADILKVFLIYPDTVNTSSKSSSDLIIWQMLKKTCAVLSESTATNNSFYCFYTMGQKKKEASKQCNSEAFFFFNPPHPSPHTDIQAEHSYSLSEGDSAPQSPALSIKMDQESGGCLHLLFPVHLFCLSNVCPPVETCARRLLFVCFLLITPAVPGSLFFFHPPPQLPSPDITSSSVLL